MSVKEKTIKAQLDALRSMPMDDILLADRYAIRRRLGRGKGGKPGAKQIEALQQQVEISRATVSLRKASLLESGVDDALPIAGESEAILEAITNHPVTIVCGATGSGKTTQLPKLCLQAGLGVHGTIGHTQPRRLAARSVAERIADEVGAQLGDQVGYKVRFGDRTGPDCRIKLMTDGILLQELKRDRWLYRYDCLIIDEAHERSLNIDFLLGYLKRLLEKRDDLKIIITSATIDPARFSSYFDDAPVIEVGGRGYPVEVRYSPCGDGEADESAAAEVMRLLSGSETRDGDVLVFLPGEKDIGACAEYLKRDGAGRYAEVLPLFARLNHRRQRKIFHPGPRRRVILATNIAETSLTVPRIRYVVDSGLARVGRYSYRSKLQRLPVEAISRASAEQRAGRCGRLGPGVCVRLYAEEDFEARPAFTDPEIRRTNLASVILQMVVLRLGPVESFPFIDRPDQRFVKDGYRLLTELNALDSKAHVTRVGTRMANLPLDPRLSRFVVAAADIGCLAEALVVASGLSVPEPRERPPGKGDNRQAELADNRSDFITLLNVWRGFHGVKGSERDRRRWCREHFVARQRMEEWRDVHRQLHGMVREQRMTLNKRPSSYADLHRAVLFGFVSHIGERVEGSAYRGARNQAFVIFPGSSVARKPPPWVMAAELVETSRVFGRNVASIKAAWIQEAGGHMVRCDYLEPKWSAERGQVTALEQARIFGLTLGSGRRVNYGPINPAVARDIFIDRMLVSPAKVPGLTFARHNAQLRAAVVEQEARVRRSLLSEDRQRAFFDERLPANVCDRKSLLQWWKKAESEDPQMLFLRKEDVGWNEKAEGAWYPQSLHVAGNDMPLIYRFEPGADADGVTLRLPIALAGHVDAAQLEWLIPGWLEEKVLALLRGLPKAQRKTFAPAPEAARRFLVWAIDNDLPGGRESLCAALCRFAREHYDVRLEPGDWQPDKLEAWQRLRVELLDPSGGVLAAGRDLARLQQRFARVNDTQTVRDDRWYRDDLRSWTVGELPDSVELEQQGLRIQGCPALIDGGSEVKLRILPNLEAALTEHRLGVVRLAFLGVNDKIKYLKKNLPDANRLSLLYMQIGDYESLLNDIVLATIEHDFLPPECTVPRNDADYLAWFAQVRRGLIGPCQELARLCLDVLTRRQKMLGDLAACEDAMPVAVREDIVSQLAHLFPAGFVRSTPRRWLEQLPRYVNALQRRVDRWREHGKENAEHADLVRDYWQRYLDAAGSDVSDKLQDYRWLVEEFRVSCFAQALGTHVPVSAKRLADAWRSARSEA